MTQERDSVGQGRRFAFRMIGIGVLLLSLEPMKNLVRYFGYYWNLGIWFAETRLSDIKHEAHS